MTKTDLSYITAGHLRRAGEPSLAVDDFKNYAGAVWFRCSDSLPAKARRPVDLENRDNLMMQQVPLLIAVDHFRKFHNLDIFRD